jgi:mRNA interferase RelE/StbE
MYEIIIVPRAEKEIRRLDKTTLSRILKAATSLAENPRPAGCLKVVSEDGVWRIRVGDYRIGYEIDDKVQTVKVIRIGHRSDFYD